MAQLPSSADRVIVFDGECNFCDAWVDFILRRDTAMVFRFASRQSEPARRLLGQFGEQPDTLNSIVLVHGHKMYTRSEAVLRIFAELPLPWKAISVLLVVPRLVREPFYFLVAKTRHRLLGRRIACRPDDREKSARFLK